MSLPIRSAKIHHIARQSARLAWERMPLQSALQPGREAKPVFSCYSSGWVGYTYDDDGESVRVAIALKQSLDRTRPFDLVSGSIRTHQLCYRYTDTNELVRVPNVWYNQPVAWRIDYIEWQLLDLREKLSKLEKQGPIPLDGKPRSAGGTGTWYTLEDELQEGMRRHRDQIQRLEASLEAMRRTGEVIC